MQDIFGFKEQKSKRKERPVDNFLDDSLKFAVGAVAIGVGIGVGVQALNTLSS